MTHLDELFKIAIYNVLAVLFTVALWTLFAREFQYHCAILLGAGWAYPLNSLAVPYTRNCNGWRRRVDFCALLCAADRCWRDRPDVAAEDDDAPKLGYQVIGVIDASKAERAFTNLNAPVLGSLVDVPLIIDRYAVDE